MLHAILTARSFRFWIGLGIATAILPFVLSAIGGYALLQHGVIASIRDVAARQRHQIVPTQHLRLRLWDAVVPVDDFVDDGDPRQPQAYRSLRQQIETAFTTVHENLRSDPALRALVDRAQDDWTQADRLAGEAISVRRPPGDPHGVGLMDRFHGLIASTVDKLGAAYDGLEAEVKRDHDAALAANERASWMSGIAAGASLLAMALGVVIIGRITTGSIDRLVDGAGRFAEGDRDHRIEVQVPPELRRVAEEFNRMIGRIQESEAALSDLARRDGLTRLLNRRAFDEALVEAIARSARLGERVALLVFDVDHFKRVNDTYGHAAGDEVLRAVAATVAADVRVFDRAFRVGGEEFAVLLLGGDLPAMRTAAERLRQSIAARPVKTKDGDISVTVSVGLAMVTAVSDPTSLCGAADAALYRAKTEGRNRVVVSGDSGVEAQHDGEGRSGQSAGLLEDV
jgi:diguanylate cyclase (GGDEF)-like protein